MNSQKQCEEDYIENNNNEIRLLLNQKIRECQRISSESHHYLNQSHSQKSQQHLKKIEKLMKNIDLTLCENLLKNQIQNKQKDDLLLFCHQYETLIDKLNNDHISKDVEVTVYLNNLTTLKQNIEIFKLKYPTQYRLKNHQQEENCQQQIVKNLVELSVLKNSLTENKNIPEKKQKLQKKQSLLSLPKQLFPTSKLCSKLNNILKEDYQELKLLLRKTQAYNDSSQQLERKQLQYLCVLKILQTENKELKQKLIENKKKINNMKTIIRYT